VASDLSGFFDDLIRFETLLWNEVDERLRVDLDLPLHRFEPMQVIARTDNCRIQDIATGLAITVGGASKLVDRIEAAGHCRRVANPSDRRSSIIELTPAGKRLLSRATKTFEQELQRRVGDAIPSRTLDQFASTLRRLRLAQERSESKPQA
jgi:DNA-binding MarR family transcriptional regulator